MNTPPQPGYQAFVYLIQFVAAALAIALARASAAHIPVAWYVSSMTAIDNARRALAGWADFDNAPRPHVGSVRLAFHLDELGFIAWPAGLVALALVVFAGRRAWPALVAWLVFGATLIALYPSDLVRGAGLQRIYLAAHLAALFVVIVCFVSWRAHRKVPGSEHAALFILAAIELVRFAPFYGSIFTQWASFVQPCNVVLYGLLVAVQGGFLWVSHRSR